MGKATPVSPAKMRQLWRDPWHLMACGFGLGMSPWMPGTCGTLLGLVIAWGLSYTHWLFSLCVCVILGVAGIVLCERTNRFLETTDHPMVVWDEVAAFPIVMLGVPFTGIWPWLGFVLFRIFDIWKPGPIRWCDRNVHGGLGVMLDDWVAAFISWVIVWGLYTLLKWN